MSMTSVGTSPTTQTYGISTPGAPGADGTAGTNGVGMGSNGDGSGPVDVVGTPPGGSTLHMAVTSPGGSASSLSEARFEAAVAQIEQQAAGSDLDVTIRALVESAGAQRHEAMQARMNARQQATNELNTEAASMTTEAKTMLKSAVTSLVVGVVASAASIAGTLGGAVKQLKSVASKTMQEVNEVKASMVKIEKNMTSGAEAAGKLKGVGKDASEATEEVKLPSTRPRADADASQKPVVDEESDAAPSTRPRANADASRKPVVDEEGDAAPTGRPRADADASTTRKADTVRHAELQDKLDTLQASQAKSDKRADRILEGFKSAGEVGNKAGESTKGFLESQNKEAEAQQKTDEAEEQYFSNREDLMKTSMENVGDMAQKVLGFQQALLEARSEGMAAFTRA